MRTIWQNNGFRIIEEADLDWDMENLKGDVYKPDLACGPEYSLEKLKADESWFEDTVINEGVYGYTLEEWNPEVGKGWEETNNSCWGFVGRYDENSSDALDRNHYIVQEFKEIAEEENV